MSTTRFHRQPRSVRSATPVAGPARVLLPSCSAAQLMIILDMTVVNIAPAEPSQRPAFLRAQPVLGAERLHPHVRRVAAAGGRAGDILAGAGCSWPASPCSPRLLAGGLATSAGGCWAARPSRARAARSPRRPSGADHGGFPRGTLAHQGARLLHRRGHGRRVARPGARRRDHRVGVLAVGAVRQRADRGGRPAVRSPVPRRVAAAARPVRRHRSAHLHLRHGRPGLCLHPGASSGWHDPLALAAFGAAASCSGCSCSPRPGQAADHRRCGCSPTAAGPAPTWRACCSSAGNFGMFFSSASSSRTSSGFSPLRAGLAFVPMTAMLFLFVSRSAPWLLARFPAKTLMVTGLLPVVAGMAWLSRLSPGAGYLPGVLVPMLLLGAGDGRGCSCR